MTALATPTLPRAPTSIEAAADVGGLTLEQRLAAAWREVNWQGVAACPVCGERMELSGGVAICGGCGSELR